MLVFLDYDGTFADHGMVPEAHRQVVRQVRAAGHQMILCTGRCRASVPTAVLDIVDGLVGSAGGYVEFGGEVLADVRFPEPTARDLLRVLDDAEVLSLLEAPDAVHARADTIPPLVEILARTLAGPEAAREMTAAIQPLDERPVRFAKVSCFGAARPLTDLIGLAPAEVALLPSSLPMLGAWAGEWYLRSVTKAEGIRTVCQRLGVGVDQVVAVGDGHNDLEMLHLAGTAVAVASGPPELVALADLVIPGPEQAGLVRAFTELGLTRSIVR